MVLDTNGEVVAASWRAFLPKGSAAAAAGVGGKRKGASGGDDGRGDFDVLTAKAPPGVVFDRPAKGKGAAAGAAVAGTEGEGEEVVEKTMLQK